MSLKIASSALVILFFTSLFARYGGAFSGATNLKVVCDRWPDTTSLTDFGNTSVTIMSAKTNEEKAIAVWRMIQQYTDTGYGESIIAREPAYGISYMLDPVKLLNVYGVHYCDGLSRIMEMTWRKMGYRAEKYYKWGHTFANIWYEDPDAIERWHLFDVSQHWFLYTRDGSRLATPEELIGDYSLIARPSNTPIPSMGSGYGHWGYVHAHHLAWPTHDMLLTLRPNETLTLNWSNEGKPYYNVWSNIGGTNTEHGPYTRSYGNGMREYSPDFSSRKYEEGLYQPPTNLTPGGAPKLRTTSAGTTGTAIWKITTPWIISDAEFSLTGVRNSASDSIVISISNNGTDWKTVYTESDTGTITVNNKNINETFNVTGSYPTGLITPFGHYDYYFRVQLYAASNTPDCGLDTLTIKTWTQHNTFSLPQLWPGRNNITVTGSIESDTSIRVTYLWDDKMGSGRENVTVIENTPYTYEILTDGAVWEDVVCKSIKIEALPHIGNGNSTVIKEAPPGSINTISPNDAFPTKSLIGGSYPSPLKTVLEYVNDLNNAISAQEGLPTDDPHVWGQASNVRNALMGLSEHGSSASWAIDDVINAIRKDRSSQYNKAHGCQTLYTISGNDAVPTLKLVLKRDSSILWADDSSLSVSAGLWINTCGAAAAILGQIANAEAKTAADDVANLLNETWVENKCGYDSRNLERWPEFRWAFVKALGKLGYNVHGTILRNILTDESADGDERALAARAVGEVGDKTSLSDVLHMLYSHEYMPQGWYCIQSIGKLGGPDNAATLYPYLTHWEENYRGYAAEALGLLGNSDAVPYLESLIVTEPFAWVREAAQNSINLLADKEPPDPPKNVRIVQ
ncbi:MAG: HEAT repeat domain-containing protein [Candidatus Hodarchaeota archaeon]